MSQQIQITGGAKVRDLQDVIIGTSGVLSSLAFDVANGVPKLDSNGKILVSQLPNSVMEYKGTWNAATNTPTLANGTGNQGDVYLCNVAGTVDFGAGPIAFVVGDQVIYSGSIWQRASGATGTVTSVAVTESGDSLNITGSPITTSGTINIGFNGTNLQYVNGAGNLTTFPILTGYVTAVSGTAPVVSSGGTTPAISMAAATALVDGYLLATDFAIFSAKQSALTFSSPLVNTSGTISIPAATTSVNGYLASADFTTFNNKQNAITLTTTGTSGASTLVGATLNIPNYGSALTGYVPYTGATQDVDLGAFKLNAQSLHIKGTGGLGHLGLKHQSASATASANEVSLFADSLGDLGWLNGNLYLSKFITSSNTAARSYTFPNATGTIALTSDISYPVTSVFGRTGAVVATSGDYTTAQVTESGNLYFTDSRARLALSFVAGSGAYNSTTGVITIPTNNTQITNGAAYITLTSLSGSTGISYNNTTGVITNSAPDQTVSLTAGAGISVSGSYPSFTIASTITQYTDALARLAISLTTTGSSGAATYNNTTGVLNIPQYIGGVTSVFGRTGAVVATEGDYSLTQLSDVTITSPTTGQVLKYNGTAWVNDTDANTGTVTSVGLSSATSGVTIGSSPITTSGTITLAIATATTSQNGLLSSADWTTFNNKQGAITLTTTGTSGAATLVGTTLNIPQYSGGGGMAIGGSITSATAGSVLFAGASGVLAQDNANFFWDDTNNRLGLGTTSPLSTLDIVVFTGGARRLLVNYDNSLITIKGAGSTAAPENFRLIGDNILFNTGNTGSGTEAMRITSGGSVTIGNLAGTGSKLQVNGSAAIGYSASTAAPTNGLAVAGNLSVGNTNNTFPLDVSGNVRITGNIGINGVAPTYPLYVRVGTNQRFRVVDGGSGYTQLASLNDAEGAYTPIMIGNSWLSIASTGAATFSGSVISGTTTTGAQINVYASSYGNNGLFNAYGTDGAIKLQMGALGTNEGFFYTGASNKLTFYSGGALALTIASTGAATFSSSVGIGTTTIGSKLQVNGNAAIGYSASTAAPTNGLAVAGAATFASSIQAQRGNFYQGASSGAAITMRNRNATQQWDFVVDAMAVDDKYLGIYDFTNSTYRLVITNGGALGLGTQTIGSKLQVNGNAAIGYSASTAAPTNGLAVSGSVFIGTTDDGGKLVSYSTFAATQIKAAGTAPAITFSNTVLSPTIGGVLGVCTAASQFFTGTASSDMVLANQFSAGDLIFGTNNLARMRVKASGVINITSIPTSSAGLVAGDIYSNAGILTIV